MRTGKPMTKRSLSDRRGTASSIAFDFGDGVASYSKTSGILTSVGRLGLIVLGGALLLATVLLRQDSQVLHVSEGSAAASTVRGAVDADRTKVTAGSDSSITLQTPHGNIVITLRPDLSSESTQYIHSLINSKSCTAQSCRLYRAEKPGILQGILKSGDEAVERGVGLVKPNTVFGRCPDEYKGVKQDCPEHDRNCGCHGPIMVKGGELVGHARTYCTFLSSGACNASTSFISSHLLLLLSFSFVPITNCTHHADRCGMGRRDGRRAGLLHQHVREARQALGQSAHGMGTRL